MTMPLVRGIGPTLIPSPQRMYLRLKTTQKALEDILRDLQDLRAQDPFRELNPLAWGDALRPEPAAS